MTSVKASPRQLSLGPPIAKQNLQLSSLPAATASQQSLFFLSLPHLPLPLQSKNFQPHHVQLLWRPAALWRRPSQRRPEPTILPLVVRARRRNNPAASSRRRLWLREPGRVRSRRRTLGGTAERLRIAWLRWPRGRLGPHGRAGRASDWLAGCVFDRGVRWRAVTNGGAGGKLWAYSDKGMCNTGFSQCQP